MPPPVSASSAIRDLGTLYTVSLRLVPPRFRGLLGGLLGLGRPLQVRLEADAAEHERDAHPLLVVEAMAVVHDGQDHGEHLAGDGDGDEGDGPEVGDRVDCCAKNVCQQERGERNEQLFSWGDVKELGGFGGNSYR